MKANLNRVGIAYFCFLACALAAIWRIVDLQFIHKPDVEYSRNTTRNDVLESSRGSILADDGRYLAFSIPEYVMCMDCMQADSALFYGNVDELGRKLSEFYKDKSAKQYANALRERRSSGRHYFVLNRRLLTYQEMKEVSSFPILEKGNRVGGLIIEKQDHREYPYGSLAYRVLGQLKNNQAEESLVGIEGKYDTLLRGTDGVQPMKLTEHNEWIPDTDKDITEPIDGIDIQTTLDIDIQDITERALRKRLNETDLLYAGCAIVMDVATGEIKAMSNLRKESDGSFTETYNYAIGQTGEPGSVFKLATLTVLLEDGKVDLDTEIDAVVNWSFHGRALPADTYLRNYKTITVQRGLEISSNNVFRMLAGMNYDHNPQEFLDKITALHYADDFDFDIVGLGKAKIKSTKDRSWNILDLPQTGMGYAVNVTPLHTVTYYNAIANGGVMVKPRLVRNYQKDGVILQEFGTEEIAKVCSDVTVAKLHKALRGVVTDGTGKDVFKNCKLEVAGKTGTARVVIPGAGYIDKEGRHQHQATFVGFFPYDNPRYTAIAVVYSVPTTQNLYGGTWAGPVVKEIADEIYATSPEYARELTARGELPKYDLNINSVINDTIKGTPNVIGMGLRDGINYLENNGYKVSFSGAGKIVSQVPEPGKQNINKEITVYLSEKK